MCRSVGDDKNIAMKKVWPCTVNSDDQELHQYQQNERLPLTNVSHNTEHKTQHIFNVKTIKRISGISLSGIL